MPSLVAITDHARYPDCIERARALCAETAPGSVAVVLRDRDASISQRLRWGEELRQITRASAQLFWMSERVDMALAVEADGVHLPADGLSPAVCRKIWRGTITRAAHDWQNLGADDFGALDGLLLSPVAQARKGRGALGPDGLAGAVSALRAFWPRGSIYALGGVTAESAPWCLERGVNGVAAIGAAWDPEERAGLTKVIGIVK